MKQLFPEVYSRLRDVVSDASHLFSAGAVALACQESEARRAGLCGPGRPEQESEDVRADYASEAARVEG